VSVTATDSPAVETIDSRNTLREATVQQRGTVESRNTDEWREKRRRALELRRTGERCWSCEHRFGSDEILILGVRPCAPWDRARWQVPLCADCATPRELIPPNSCEPARVQ
jgi:hypothetical protein